jgi:predicted ATPase/transcriptional regulator with XRE-family HTH domain
MDGECGATFGMEVRRYRLRAGLSQEALAERAGLATSAISALETGARRRPHPHTLQALAVALGLSDAERQELTARARRTVPPAPGEEAVVPAPSGRTPAVSLPAPLTSFVGRERELAAFATLVQAGARLVTLTGPGGAGKTRLAIEGVRVVQRHFPDGVWFVGLGSLADAALVPQAVATVLGVREQPESPFTRAVAERLRDCTGLLLLDNCEHLLDACGALVLALLPACPRLTVIATSRAPLAVAGEQVYPVPLLPVPPPDWRPAGDDPAALEGMDGFPALRLFMERARAVRPDFALTAATAPTAAELCRRLDGLPLAIELAAARTRVIPPEQIVARLRDRFRLVAGNSRDIPRHQTLGALIDWSYDLLTESEKALFRRLSVFAGGFTLEAAEVICFVRNEGGGDTAQADVLDLLTALVDQSLVVVDAREEGWRYRMLESIREYAAEKLEAADEVDVMRTHHAAFYLRLAEQASSGLRGSEQIAWMQRLDREQDNLRAALQWAKEHGDGATGVRLAVAIIRFWEVRGYLSEGRHWLTTMLTGQGMVPLTPALRTQALLHAGRLSYWLADLAEGRALLEKCLMLARELGDRRVIAHTLLWLGATHRRGGAFAVATELLEESVRLQEVVGNERGAAAARFCLGCTLGTASDFAKAAPLLEESLGQFRALDDVRYVAAASLMLGSVLTPLGDLDRAVTLLLEGLAGMQAVGDRAFLLSGLLALAWAFAQMGRQVSAAHLLGAAEALHKALGAGLAPIDRIAYDEALAAIRARMTERELDAARTEGATMPMADVIEDALSQRRSSPTAW